MTGEILVAVSGVVLSLVFSYVPGAADWYNKFDSVKKSGIMALLILVVGLSVYGLSCAQFLNYFTCDSAGAWKAVQMVILALVANQGTYQLSPRLNRFNGYREETPVK